MKTSFYREGVFNSKWTIEEYHFPLQISTQKNQSNTYKLNQKKFIEKEKKSYFAWNNAEITAEKTLISKVWIFSVSRLV